MGASFLSHLPINVALHTIMAKSNEDKAPEGATEQTQEPVVSVQAFDASARAVGEQLRKGKKRLISLAPATANEPKTVPVIINGYRYEVQRGVDVEVPEAVALILREAGYR